MLETKSRDRHAPTTPEMQGPNEPDTGNDQQDVNAGLMIRREAGVSNSRAVQMHDGDYRKIGLELVYDGEWKPLYGTTSNRGARE